MRLLLVLLLCVQTHAAIIDAASASLVDVTAAYDSAVRGVDTIRVPAGSATWANALTVSKGVRIIGNGIDSTVITRGGTIIAIAPDATAIANEEVIQVSGFTFDGNDAALTHITVAGAGPSEVKPFKNLIITTNKFKDSSTTTAGNGAVSLTKQVRGVIAENIFDRCNVIVKVMGNDHTNDFALGNFPFVFGNGDNLFFEDNTISYSSAFSGLDPGWIESGQGARIVVRYCQWDMANGGNQNELWDVHGFQNWGSSGQTGTMGCEYYGNSAVGCNGYRWINHRGVRGLFFNNIVTGDGGFANNVTMNAGCNEDVPGTFETEIVESYFWNNTQNGTELPATENTDLCGIAENANWWNFSASFDGTVGIGRSTTAPTGSATTGVGYWVASTATPTTNAVVIQAGTLYVATATDVWTPYYTPYTYPHPLRGEAAEAPPVTAFSGNAEFSGAFSITQ